MTVVTDVIARLRADTTDFSRGFAQATAQVKALETATARSQTRISASTSTMANATAVFGQAAKRNANLYRASLGTMGATAAVAAGAVRIANEGVSNAYEEAALATETSLRRSATAHGRQRDALNKFVAGAAATSVATDKVGSGFDDMSRRGSRFGTVAMGMTTALKGIGVAGGVALAAGGAAMGAFSMKGIMAAARFEQTTLAFESSFQSMGRSAEEAQQYLTDLRDFAAKTPFELTGLLDSVRGLMTIGKTPEQILGDLLPAIGDMAAMMGVGEEAIGRVVFAFRQIAGSPKVLAQDLYQIQNALPGFNAKMGLANDKILAMAAGFKKGNIAEYQKAVESGAITGAMAVDALIRAMKKFPGAAGMMEKQSKTLTGVISTFKDEVNNALIDGFAPAIPAISGALLKLLPAVKTLTEGFAGAMGPVVAQLVNEVAPAFVKMSETLGPIISKLIGALGPVLQYLLPLIGTLGQAIGGVLVAALNQIAPVIQALMPSVQLFLTTLAASLYPVIQALGPVLRDFATAFGTLLTALIPMLPAIAQLIIASLQLVPSFTVLATATANIVTALMPIINLFTSLSAQFMRFNPQLKLMNFQMEMLARVFDLVARGINALTSRGLPVLNRFAAVAQKAFAAARAAISVFVEYLDIGGKLAKAEAAVKGFASAVIGFLQKPVRWVKSTWSALGNLIPAPISAAFDWISNMVQRFAKWIVTQLGNMAGNMVNALKKGFADRFPGFTSMLGNAQSAAISAFQSYEPAWSAVGNNHAAAYAEGFESAFSEFISQDIAPGKTMREAMRIANLAKPGKQAVPGGALDAGMGGGGDAGGGGGGSAAEVEEEVKKWYNTLNDLSKGLKQLAKDGLTKGEVNTIVNRSRGLLAQFSEVFSEEQFRKSIEKIKNSGKNINKAIDDLVNKMSNALNRFRDKASNEIKAIRQTFARFAELALRAFDAETAAQVQGIRDQYASGSVITDFAKNAMPNFGDIFDVGDGGLADSLEKSIGDMRSGLSSALSGLFGTGGQMDMSMKAITGRFNTAMKAIEKARNDALAAAGKAREAEYEAAQTTRESLTPAEQMLKDMNEAANVENLMRNKSEAEEALAAAQKIRNTRQRNAAVLEAQRRLDEALRAIQIDALQKQAEEERKAKEEAYQDQISAADEKYNKAVEEADRLYTLASESAQREYDAQVAHNQRMEEEATRNREFEREQDRIALEESLRRLEENLSKKNVNWKKWKRDYEALMGDAKFAQAMRNAGVNLGASFSAGLDRSKNKIETALQEIARLVEKYLKVKSPTDMGPMSDLNQWWRGFGDTLIDGFDEREFARKLGASVSKVPMRVGADLNVMPKDGYMSIMPYPNDKNAGAPVTIQITVQGSVIQERDLAESIREELIKIGRRDGTIFGGIV